MPSLRDCISNASLLVSREFNDPLRTLMSANDFLSLNWVSRFYNLHPEEVKVLHKFVGIFFNCDVLGDRAEDGDCIRRRWDGAFLVGQFSYRTRTSHIPVPWDNLCHHSSFSRQHLRIPLEWMICDPQRRVHEAVAEVYEGWEQVYFGSTHLTEIWFYLLAYAWLMYKHELHLNLGEIMFDASLVGSVEEAQRYHCFQITSHTFVHTRGNTRSLRCESSLWRDGEKAMPVEKKQRTLLSLIRTYKKKRDALITNPNAYTLLWLTQRLTNLPAYKREWNQGMYDPDPILAWLEKVTKEPWKYVDRKFYPQCMTKSYWHFNIDELDEPVQVWVLAARWKHMKERQEILWNPEDDEWWHFLSKITYSTIETVEGELACRDHTIFPPRNYKEVFKHCDSCSRLYKKTDLSFDQDTESHLCEICSTSINTEPDRMSVFGRYHSHHSWKWNYMRTKQDNPKEFCFGLEVEMHTKLDNSQVGAGSAAWFINQARKKAGYPVICYFERDGSLGEGGLEMVTNPMSLNYHKEFWGTMLPKIREVAVGWNTKNYHNNDEWYGIHMTFARKYWTDLQLARLVKFLEWGNNNIFVLGLAQRKQIFNGGNLGVAERPKLKDRAIVENGKIIGGPDRYIPVNFKGKNLVELRFFRSTLNTESFFKNLEWLWSFHLWCQHTAFNLDYKNYLNWVMDNPKILKEVPNLITYFSRDKLPVRGCTRNSLTNLIKELVKNKKPGQTALFDLEPTALDSESILEGDIECASF